MKLRTTRAYEADRDLLASVENRYAPAGANTLISKYEYTNNDLSLRTEVAYSGTAFGSPSPPPTQPFGYNDRNELTSSTLHGSPDKDWTSEYDPTLVPSTLRPGQVGNRVAARQPVG